MKENRFLRPKVILRQKIILVLFGLFLFFMLLEASLRLGGFLLLSIQEYRNLQSIKQKGAYRILCLGESTTAGQYPRFLAEALNQSHIPVRFSVINKGIGGINTSAILSQVESYLADYQPNMVVSMMGINDAEEFIPFEVDTTAKGILFIRSFRIYKLARLLWLRILTKAEEIGVYKLNEDRRSFKEVQTYLPRTWLNKTHAKTISLEDSFKKALELNPKNDNAYVGLGWIYRDQDKYSQAEDSFKKALELNPKNDNAYAGLGWTYRDQGKYPETEDAFRKAIELNHKKDNVYIELGRIYRDQDKYSQAEGLFKKAIELNPKNNWAYGALSVLYAEIGELELAKEYTQKVNRLRLEYFTPATVDNYRKLKQILDRRKIKLVCAQYPMRNVEPLKKIFKQDAGVVFVDNESIFKEALKKASYKEYFIDMFAGDFGHCTEKGNRILAQNIANVILKEIFKKSQ